MHKHFVRMFCIRISICTYMWVSTTTCTPIVVDIRQAERPYYSVRSGSQPALPPSPSKGFKEPLFIVLCSVFAGVGEVGVLVWKLRVPQFWNHFGRFSDHFG